MHLILAFGGQRQEYLWKLEVNLVFITHSKPIKALYQGIVLEIKFQGENT